MKHEHRPDRLRLCTKFAMAAKAAPAVIAVRERRAHTALRSATMFCRRPSGRCARRPDRDRRHRGLGQDLRGEGLCRALLETGARVAIVDPLGVWWGLRASADGTAPGYPVIVFGGRHADVPITAEMGARPRPADRRPRRWPASSICRSSAATRRAGASWRRSPKRSTRRMRSRCTWSSTRPICGRRSGR